MQESRMERVEIGRALASVLREPLTVPAVISRKQLFSQTSVPSEKSLASFHSPVLPVKCFRRKVPLTSHE